jgi:Putative metallopeptidase
MFRVGTRFAILAVGCFVVSMPAIAQDKAPAAEDTSAKPFSVVYQPSLKFKEIAKTIKDGRRLQHWVRYLNATYDLEKDIVIIFADCGMPNAYYAPDKHQIVLCYDIINEMTEVFGRYYKSSEEVKQAARNALTFVFLHEVGHALIDANGLHLTGIPETNADQLATYILLSRPIKEGKINVAFDGAQYFGLLGENRLSEKAPGDEQMEDEHPLSKQRYFQILCWVYGSSPTPHNKAVIMAAGMSERRLSRCPGEYQNVKSAWDERVEEPEESDD